MKVGDRITVGETELICVAVSDLGHAAFQEYQEFDNQGNLKTSGGHPVEAPTKTEPETIKILKAIATKVGANIG